MNKLLLTGICSCFITLSSVMAHTTSASQAADARKLETGQPVEREIRSGETHAYELTLEAGQYANIVITQRDVDVTVTATGPDGKPLPGVGTPNVPQGPEPVHLLAEAAGSYRLSLRPSIKEAAAGRYEIRLVELRAAAEKDRALEEARKLYIQSVQLGSRGKFSDGIPLAERALAIRERELGPEHLEVATSRLDLAILYEEKGDFAKAEPLYARALEIREKQLPPDHPAIGHALNTLGLLYNRKAEYARAEPLLVRALEIREKTQGPNHPNVAQSLNNLALVHSNLGNYDKAIPLAERAVAIVERASSPDDPNIVAFLNTLAILYLNRGEYAKAEPLFVRGLEIREKKLEPDHPYIAQSLNSLAILYSRKGEYAKAVPLAERAVAIREKELGPNHPNLAQSLNSLAALYSNKGEYAKAEPLYLRALAIREKELGLDHPNVAASLNTLAVLYINRGDHARAEPLCNRALQIYEKKLAANHPNIAQALNNLAVLRHEKGEYAEAGPLFARALEIYEKALSPGHSLVAKALNNMALLHQENGEYDRAEPLFTRASEIYEKAFGPEHPDFATSLSNLAALCLAKNDLAQAITLQSRANEARERDLTRNLAAGSERQKLLYLNLSAREADRTLSLHLTYAPQEATAMRLAAASLLRRKGRALDAMTDSIATLRRRAAPADRALLDQAASARARLSAATLRGPGREGADRHRANLKALAEQVEKLESQISARSAEFRAQSAPVTLEAVQQAIPPGAALVEFALYRPFQAKVARKEGQYGLPRYAAYVLRHQGGPAWVELGEAKAIDEKVSALRKALRSPRRKDVKALARALYGQVMRPLRSLLGPTRRVLLSPDGALNLIPFAALVDERNRYLVRQFSFSYLTSGRDLLRLQTRVPSKRAAAVIANPDFGGAALRPSRRGLKVIKAEVEAGKSIGYFPPLPGTRQEARALRTMLPGATLLTRAGATETAVKQLESPDVLHIATHGFFLEDGANRPALREGRLLLLDAASSSTVGLAEQLENPLLRSGLGLAGANLKKSGDDDGILTALEAAGLDLWGTKLVVLSACDTGVGEVKNGEGVYGLRRALVLAGSESQVISLWPVSDTGTRDLMVDYYKALQAGQGRSEALRQVQLKMLARKNRSHPYYWASFIQSGEWADLDGMRR